ncbi:MAG: cobyric acid synthase, partial [Desulfobacula sp.]|uniref:cobyric acid synthase n=1 Tax=Desulfobacula sp. TaxID=2593537 RepID=UPI0025BBE0A6
MMKKNIAILGTGSDVGKSIIAAALCRSLADRGVKVAPFKSQNMSNNSGITPEGLEMGRAQIVQAEASKIVPHVNMNPILLKPTGEKQSQVILNGRVYGNHTAMDYHRNKGFYFEKACEAFDHLGKIYDRIILEGAGSCAEVNLMPNDIVNFPMAEYANADVILAADIHRGGVFAQIVGTLECLPQKYRDMIKGFIINRFRGDIALFKDGVDWIEKQTHKKVLGVLPWYTHFKIDAEDSVEIEECNNFKGFNPDIPAIGIIRLPHIANFTDFHALSKIKGIQTIFIDRPDYLSKFNAVIIPGSKNTRADLEWLTSKFKNPLKEYYQSKGYIFGICGGYQMLGEFVDDPDGLEGIAGKTKALNLLPVQTVLKAPKTTTLSGFQWGDAKGKGYEIHMGYTTLRAGTSLLAVNSRNCTPCSDIDGCMSEDRRVAGTYMHGFFDSSQILSKWLKTIGLDNYPCDDILSSKEKDYMLLKEHFEAHI